MIEIMKPIKQKKLGIEAIHGHTRIELKDVRTGIRDRIESDNVVTDGAESLLRSMGVCNVNLMPDISSAPMPICAYLFGGIFLLNDIVPTSPQAKYVPAGVKMTGNGSYKVSNSTVVTEMGSYNEVESSLTKNKFEQVYDFSTQQANGVIKSVCLTSALAGYAGMGNPSSQVPHPTQKVFTVNGNPMFQNYHTSNLDMAMVCKGNRAYILNDGNNIAANVTEVTLKEVGFTLNEFSAFNEYQLISGITSNRDVAHNPTLSESTITLPAHTTQLIITHLDGLMYLIPWPNNYAFANGASFDIYVLDTETKTLTTKHITNNSGKAVSLYNEGTKGSAFVGVTDSIMFCNLGASSSGPYTLGIIDLTNGTISDSGVSLSGNTPTAYIKRFIPGFVEFGYNTISGFNNAQVLYDIVNATFYPTNLASNPAFGNWQRIYDEPNDALMMYNGGVSGAIMPHPWRLTTINNLGSAVTKDATKTMKVTYTLTFS